MGFGVEFRKGGAPVLIFKQKWKDGGSVAIGGRGTGARGELIR